MQSNRKHAQNTACPTRTNHKALEVIQKQSSFKLTYSEYFPVDSCFLFRR